MNAGRTTDRRTKLARLLAVLVLIVSIVSCAALVRSNQISSPIPVVLDTDIGTDVDDALALGVVLGSPEIALAGVTTVYGDTVQRAQIATRFIRLADLARKIPVVVGQGQPLSHRPVWNSGHEGELIEDLALEHVDRSPNDDHFLVDTARRYRGELVVLAVGPLTNIALALRLDPEFADNVKELVIMGGDFRAEGRTPEYNFYSDIVATREVFDSELHIAVGGLDLTTQTKLSPTQRQVITKCGPFGIALADELDAWWQFQGHPWNNPHDPTLAMWLVRPELFSTRNATVTIGDNGLSIDQHDQTGRFKIVEKTRSGPMLDAMMERICAAREEDLEDLD